ncbi:hypothetical protein V6N00_13375 [Tersicoccus sp. MR15.9]|uniref:hypothetical protein n=1 Tax=Tersicoccus mangrovi TaxID=3121635 RepID=UPI002FE6597A
MDEHEEAARILGRALSLLVVLSLVAVAVAAVMAVLPAPFWPWVGSWLIPWAQTPGFAGAAALVGGLAAVGAAWIAYRGARRQAIETRRKTDRDAAAARKQETWKRAQWAFDLMHSGDSLSREIALTTLTALVEDGELTDEADGRLIARVATISVSNWAADAQDSPDEEE